MGKVQRFVQPLTKRYDLSEAGDWVEIKDELNAGERERLNGLLLSGIAFPTRGDEEEAKQINEALNVNMNMAEAKLGKVETYLVDWSFRDDSGDPVDVTRSAIESLTPDTLDEISEIIDNHTQTQDSAKKAKRQKVPAGAQS